VLSLAVLAMLSTMVRYGWRSSVLVSTAAFVVMLAFARRIDPTPPENPDVRFRDRIKPTTVFELPGRPVVAYTTVIAVLVNFSWQAFASFFPTFLVEYHAVSQERASLVFAAIFAVSIACFPGPGRLSDRYGRDYVLAGGSSAGVLGYGVFSRDSALWVSSSASRFLPRGSATVGSSSRALSTTSGPRSVAPDSASSEQCT